MTTYTRAGLAAQIADDLARSDLSQQILDAIENAIEQRKTKRFYFNETRSTTFATVANQSEYSSSDDTDIPLFLELDQVFVTDSGGSVFPIDSEDPGTLTWLLGNGASTGRPFSYAYYDRKFVLYPIPDGVYTITPMGHIEVAAPASDSEANNVWMTEAFEMIRSDAKAYLYAHTIRDSEQAAVMVDAAQGAKNTLMSATNRRVATGDIERTSF